MIRQAARDWLTEERARKIPSIRAPWLWTAVAGGVAGDNGICGRERFRR